MISVLSIFRQNACPYSWSASWYINTLLDSYFEVVAIMPIYAIRWLFLRDTSFWNRFAAMRTVQKLMEHYSLTCASTYRIWNSLTHLEAWWNYVLRLPMVLPPKIRKRITSQTRFVQALFANLCWESWVIKVYLSSII